MSNKVDRAIHGPGWGEVILGAVLSIALGVALGAVTLVAKPVEQVKQPPKEEERKPNTVYYIEGARGGVSTSQALAKRKAFVEGRSVSVTEEELNALVPAARTAAAQAGKKDEPAEAETFVVGAANFRVRDGVVQIGAPVTLNVLGLSRKLIVQGRGGIEKRGDIFVFDPDEIYIGSCPIQRLPFVAGYVEKKFLAAQEIPQDVATMWRSLADVSVEGNTVKLTLK